jgi:hypothetical protein
MCSFTALWCQPDAAQLQAACLSMVDVTLNLVFKLNHHQALLHTVRSMHGHRQAGVCLLSLLVCPHQAG